MAIKNDEIKRIVNNYNRKIARLKLKGAEQIPKKASRRNLRDIEDKRELRRELNKLKRFTRRGAEEILEFKSGLKITKWEYDNLQKERQRVLAKLNEQLNKYENRRPTVLGKKQDVTFAQMGSQEYLNIRAKKRAVTRKKIKSFTQDELERYKRLLDKLGKRDRNQIKENLLEIMRNNAYMIGYDKEKIDTIIEKMDEVKDTDFIEMVEDEKAIKVMYNFYKVLSMPAFNPRHIESDLVYLFDNLYESIDEIVENYK